MPFLVDTDTLSELRRPRPNAGVLAWFGRVNSREVYISVLTLGEIRRGIERLKLRDGARAAGLDEWLTSLAGKYAVRTIGDDYEVTDYWGRIDSVAKAPDIDGLIAATALVRGWTVVTRNVADFARTGASVLNPFT